MAGRACMVGGCMAERCAWQRGMHGRGCMAGGHTWQGGACMAGGHAWPGGMRGRRVCMAGGGVHGRGAYLVGVCMVGGGACMAGKTAIASGGTHPTGMHSCIENNHESVYSVSEKFLSNAPQYLFRILVYLRVV